MSSTQCPVCGKQKTASAEACSTACDLVRRLPRSEEGLPISWQLGLALAWGFAVFNHALLTGGHLMALGMDRPDFETPFRIGSFIAGAIALAGNVFFLFVARPKRIADGVASVLSLVAALALGWYARSIGWPAAEVGFSLFNVLIAIWLSRGLRRG